MSVDRHGSDGNGGNGVNTRGVERRDELVNAPGDHVASVSTVSDSAARLVRRKDSDVFDVGAAVQRCGGKRHKAEHGVRIRSITNCSRLLCRCPR